MHAFAGNQIYANEFGGLALFARGWFSQWRVSARFVFNLLICIYKSRKRLIAYNLLIFFVIAGENNRVLWFAWLYEVKENKGFSPIIVILNFSVE